MHVDRFVLLERGKLPIALLKKKNVESTNTKRHGKEKKKEAKENGEEVMHSILNHGLRSPVHQPPFILEEKKNPLKRTNPLTCQHVG